MTLVEMLRENAEYAFKEFMGALDGVTEPQAWAILPDAGVDYLHTNGSIQDIVLHCASCKRAYGSICFRDTEIRWRECAEEIEKFEPSWQRALDYLAMAHGYWMESWSDYTDERLSELRPTNYKKDWPAWELIRMMNQHDSYHAGQIAVLRYGVGTSDIPPPSAAEDIRKHCADSKHW